ncbi:hypothetical protein FFLO_07088 [Filobasidium floriforme]|uniref:Uncharacterized protein n=1 Tax=Filobasidium floriforme TaxID=5210 RepID=A0A8K0JFM9_9TREE|nr:uncharacterized protein HD553DRAFT_327358 [Filobasidium floriforme]KAG7527282.1 hypothetical protein FFLO_07088 [Filobasidium floriforme]KAH8077298.1 hypothetical protein HD553DRAFT_327358 [Filobasidium floriforme]
MSSLARSMDTAQADTARYRSAPTQASIYANYLDMSGTIQSSASGKSWEDHFQSTLASITSDTNRGMSLLTENQRAHQDTLQELLTLTSAHTRVSGPVVPPTYKRNHTENKDESLSDASPSTTNAQDHTHSVPNLLPRYDFAAAVFEEHRESVDVNRTDVLVQKLRDIHELAFRIDQPVKYSPQAYRNGLWKEAFAEPLAKEGMKDIRPDICMVLSGESRYPCDVTQAEWAMLSGIGLSARWFNILPDTPAPQPEDPRNGNVDREQAQDEL